MSQVEEHAPVFRAPKRRKFIPKRPLDDDAEIATPPPATAQDESTASAPITAAEPTGSRNDPSDEQDERGISVAEILRQQQLAKKRARRPANNDQIIHITNGPRIGEHSTSSSAPARPGEKEASVTEIVTNRFVTQTGKVPDTENKHMMAYIESKLAEMDRRERRAAQEAAEKAEAEAAAATSSSHNDVQPSSDGLAERPKGRMPTSLGKLEEIDLGPDTALRNLERTAEAMRRLEQGGNPSEADQTTGKRRRHHRRKTSAELRREQLVEEVLRETRLDLYDDPTGPPGGPDDPTAPTSAANPDEADDERIAEQFRREFLEQIRERNSRRLRRPAINAPPKPRPKPGATGAGAAGAARTDRISRGPKLGGSRAARAAMHAKQKAAAAAAGGGAAAATGPSGGVRRRI